MGIDAKETISVLWKILGFLMNTSIKFMINHPILSGISIFLLVLYIFLPSVLFFLIYSSPVIVCGLVYAREKLGLRFCGLYKPESCGGEKRCHLQQQRSVRRNARMKVEEWDSQTSEEEKNKVILTSLYNDLLGRKPHFEESPKAIETNVLEEKEDNEKGFIGEEVSRDLGHLNVEEGPVVCNCEIKYGEGEDKEEMKEEMSNVIEPSISEIERNKRLESLIARRRARRLFRLALDQRNKLHGDENTSPRHNNNLHITVSRNSLEKRRNYPSDAIPGSAPSVLGRNPFDIPYDPQEEKPNLTGDSFDEEFSLFNNQRDMFFCRHESFCRLALFSPEAAQCMNSPVSVSDVATTRKSLDLDNEYMVHTEQKLPCNGKEAIIEEEDKSVEIEKDRDVEVEMNDETDSNKDVEVKMNDETGSNKAVEVKMNDESGSNKALEVEMNDETRSNIEVEMNDETDSNKEDDDDSSCSEESEPELNRLNKEELREAICQSMDKYPGYLVNQTRNSIPNALPRGLVAPRVDDNMFYTRKCGNSHNRTFSVASDMQVEVSEIGSPPTTVDWLDDWSNGGESYMFDTDIDREIDRNEEARNRISQQYESRSGIRSKEENTEPGTKTDQNFLLDEDLITFDDMRPLQRRSQTEEIFEHKPSSSSDVSKPTTSGKGMLFHTSASLSSITEEPETIMDLIDGDNSENLDSITEELTHQRSLPSLDSTMKNLIDEELTDMQRVVNDDLCGSPKVNELDIIDQQQKDQIMNSTQGEDEAIKSLLDASLETPSTESLERKVEEEETRLGNLIEDITNQKDNETDQRDLKSSTDHVLTDLLGSEVMEENSLDNGRESFKRKVEEEESRLGNLIEDITKQKDNETDQSDLKSSTDYVLTDLLGSEVMEENSLELVNTTDERPTEEENTHNVLEASLDNPHTQTVSDVILPQVQDSSDNSPLDESTDHQELSKEGGNSELFCITTQEHKNTEKESVVAANSQNSQDPQPSWTQQCDTDSSSPRTFEISQQLTKENGLDLVKTTDEKSRPTEEENTHNIIEASSDQPHTQIGSDVILLQVQDSNDSSLHEATDHQEISKEADKSELSKDSCNESTTQEHKTTEEESVVAANSQNSQDLQPCTQQSGTDSSQGISPRTLEIFQQLDQEDVITPNTVSQNIEKDESAAVANDLAASENNNEDNQKLYEQGEAIESLESLHHNIGLVSREDDEESKKVSEMQTTKDENGVLEE